MYNMSLNASPEIQQLSHLFLISEFAQVYCCLNSCGDLRLRQFHPALRTLIMIICEWSSLSMTLWR